MDHIYDFIGAILGNLIIYHLIKFVLKRLLDGKILISLSFVGTAIAILCITALINNFIAGFTLYMPALFILLVYEFSQLRIKKEIKDENEQENEALFK